MFWSKIWLFLLAAAAALAITVALLLPRPAQRARVEDERQRLVVACDVVNIQPRRRPIQGGTKRSMTGDQKNLRV